MKVKKFTRGARLLAVAASLVTAAALAAPTAVADSHATAAPSAAQLAKASDGVLKADIGGTSWYTDKATGKVVVTVDSTVSAAEIAKIKKTAGDQSGALQIKHTPGKFNRLIAGGEAIYGAGARCSLGFNVVGGGVYYALTAGHCTNGRPSWTFGGGTLGNVAAGQFPTYDYGVIRHANNANADGRVYLHNGTYRDIVNANTPSVGQRVERSGSTTGWRTGNVTALNATVNYGGGQVVYGTIQTNVCGQPGDSGGPLFSGNTAHGLLSGGSGNCTSGGITFYEPVTRPLGIHGLSVF
ncbi:serine protease [Streptomyces inusitatus]|uniref:Serine protease n=1 Tax=Streptomyces inusitatus TaxID=68221 RepID=A0A918UN18_9ACTN|nr:S1 family peptidase [Streptomyces inusitatus]GGZ21612.1 serine protease [Streptomyces inusitatus]